MSCNYLSVVILRISTFSILLMMTTFSAYGQSKDAHWYQLLTPKSPVDLGQSIELDVKVDELITVFGSLSPDTKPFSVFFANYYFLGPRREWDAFFYSLKNKINTSKPPENDSGYLLIVRYLNPEDARYYHKVELVLPEGDLFLPVSPIYLGALAKEMVEVIDGKEYQGVSIAECAYREAQGIAFLLNSSGKE